MDTTDVGSRAGPVAAFLFAAIAGLIGVDIAADYRSGTEASHVLTETGVMALLLRELQFCGGSFDPRGSRSSGYR